MTKYSFTPPAYQFDLALYVGMMEQHLLNKFMGDGDITPNIVSGVIVVPRQTHLGFRFAPKVRIGQIINNNITLTVSQFLIHS